MTAVWFCWTLTNSNDQQNLLTEWFKYDLEKQETTINAHTQLADSFHVIKLNLGWKLEASL